MVTFSAADDTHVVASLVARDEETFTRLVRDWSPAMLRLARYYVGSAAVAEEVVQETWIAVLTQISGFEGRSSLRTWVLRICANVGRRHGVREKRALPIGELSQVPTVPADRFRGPADRWPGHWSPDAVPAAWGPEGQTLSHEAMRVLAEGVRQLPERQGHVVALRDVHGLSTAEIAEFTGTSEGNVRVLLHRGRATLRERLATYFAEAEEDR